MISVIRFVFNSFDNVINAVLLRLWHVNAGKKVKIIGRIFVRNRGCIDIGDDVIIRSSYRSNPIGFGQCTSLLAMQGGVIRIGSRVGISNSAICAAVRVEIEDDVMIGGGCKIFDTDFHSLDHSLRGPSKQETGVSSKPVLLKKGSFLGAGSLILKGVQIGEFSVIGAGSVVTKSVPDRQLWAGNPARFIREL